MRSYVSFLLLFRGTVLGFILAFVFPQFLSFGKRESGLPEIGLKGAKRCCVLPQFCEESK